MFDWLIGAASNVTPTAGARALPAQPLPAKAESAKRHRRTTAVDIREQCAAAPSIVERVELNVL
jgi:hypothetical protein